MSGSLDKGSDDDRVFKALASPTRRAILDEGEALVRVHAAALNFFDILMIGGKYQVKPPLPFAPGNKAQRKLLTGAFSISRRAIRD